MSFREKSAWISFVSILLVFGIYFVQAAKTLITQSGGGNDGHARFLYALRLRQALICSAELCTCTTTGRSLTDSARAIAGATSASLPTVMPSAPKLRAQAAKSGLRSVVAAA